MFAWILVILVVVAIFEAHRMPELKSAIEAKTKEGVEAVKKGAKKAEEKIAKAKAAKEEKEDKE